MRFEFATATRILFGAGKIKEVPEVARAFGQRALVVTGRSTERAAPLIEGLRSAGLDTTLFPVAGEPTIQSVMDGIRRGREAKAELVLSLGGGSAIDAGKAIAALLTNPGDLLDYLEVIGRGRSIDQFPLPFIAIPTTAGTGTEVTRNAVLASPEQRVKVSLRSPLLLPRLAVVDAELTYRLPLEITAATGLDALTQLIEPLVSCRANPITDALCREGLSRAARSLPIVCDYAVLPENDPGLSTERHTRARDDMALASLLSGLALANAGLGAVHGFAAPIGGGFHAPHGAVCAALLQHVVAINVRTLRERAPDSEPLRRYTEVARLLTRRTDASADDAVTWLNARTVSTRIPSLGHYGITPRHVTDLVAKAAQASSMKGNPIVLTSIELTEILTRALTR